MTVDSAYYIEDYLNDGSDTYVFKYENTGEETILVYAKDAENNLLLLLTKDVEYTIELDPAKAPSYVGGVIKIVDPSYWSPGQWSHFSIQRETPAVKRYDAIENQSFDSLQFEFDMDRICYIQQEIEGTSCDCRDGEPPIGPPDAAVVATCLRQSTDRWVGYHSAFGRVATDSDGGTIMWNYQGKWYLEYTHDEFQTAALLPSNKSTTQDYLFTCLTYDPMSDRWFAIDERESTNVDYFLYVPNQPVMQQADWVDIDTVTGTVGINSQYTHGLTVDSGGWLFSMYYNDQDAISYYDVDSWESVERYGFPITGGTQSWWTVLQIGPGTMLQTHASQGDNVNHRVQVYSRDLTETDPQIYYQYFANRWYRYAASRGDDRAVFDGGYPGGSIFNLDYYYVGYSQGSPLPFVEIDFGAEIAVNGADICYAAGPDVYMVTARDATDDSLLHIRYCRGDDITEWLPVDSAVLDCAMDLDRDRQLYWSHDQVFYFVYQEDVAGTLYSRLVKLDFSNLTTGTGWPLAPAPYLGTVDSLLNFESMGDGTTITDTGVNSPGWVVGGGAVITSGRLVFDGIDSLIGATPTPAFQADYAGDFTIEFKVKIGDAAPVSPMLFMVWRTDPADYDGYGTLQNDASPNRTLWVADSDSTTPWDLFVESTQTFITGDEIEVAITRSGDSVYCHMNGIYQGDANIPGLNPDLDAPIYFGDDPRQVSPFLGELLRYRMSSGAARYGDSNYPVEDGDSYS